MQVVITGLMIEVTNAMPAAIALIEVQFINISPLRFYKKYKAIEGKWQPKKGRDAENDGNRKKNRK